MKKVVVFISTLIIISFLISCTGENLSNSIDLADRKGKNSFSSIVISQYNTEKFERLNIEKR